jgi:Rad3-related DNA helicase
VVEAPTGLGKTAAVSAAAKAYAEERRLRILWLTRTASQVRQVASETGATPVYGRRLLCLHEVISRVDQRRFNQTCRATRQSGRCPYYPGRPRAVKATTVSELKDAGARTSTCPYEIQLLNLSASTALVATHRQLGLIGWLLAKWRWSRERTILVLDEGQHVVQEALTMVRDSVSLKTVAKAASEAERYGFGDLSDRLREAAEYYGGLLRADEGMRYYKWFLIIQRFVAEAWRKLFERFLEVFRYPVDRVLKITPTPNGIIIVQNEWNGRLRTWMIPSVATLRWLIHEATAGEKPPRIYHLPPLNSIVLEREPVERFHIVARP